MRSAAEEAEEADGRGEGMGVGVGVGVGMGVGVEGEIHWNTREKAEGWDCGEGLFCCGEGVLSRFSAGVRWCCCCCAPCAGGGGGSSSAGSQRDHSINKGRKPAAITARTEAGEVHRLAMARALCVLTL